MNCGGWTIRALAVILKLNIKTGEPIKSIKFDLYRYNSDARQGLAAETLSALCLGKNKIEV